MCLCHCQMSLFWIYGTVIKASIKFGRLGKPSTNLPSTHSSFPCFGTAPTCEVHPDPVLLRTVLSFAFPGPEGHLNRTCHTSSQQHQRLIAIRSACLVELAQVIKTVKSFM
ncbi:hypothetical protein POPTR_T124808v4 [Populus trichocarpa]|uniref:Uncharacterized protein n=1 Tax=Populus trichocarpa TaxID=3694 RepID=A0ACC0RI01_POPTR|nr:hypothetical protein POPTR_T124808v4 [Populus trichocarpa]